jgi:hypothetical protein
MSGEYYNNKNVKLYIQNNNENIKKICNEYQKTFNIIDLNNIIDKFNRLIKEKDWLELFYNGNVYDKNNNNILPEEIDKGKAQLYKKYCKIQNEKKKQEQEKYMKSCIVNKNISFADI